MKVRRKSQSRNPDLPLFVWADQRDRQNLPLAVIVLARRYGLPPQRARLISELAGFGARQ